MLPDDDVERAQAGERSPVRRGVASTDLVEPRAVLQHVTLDQGPQVLRIPWGRAVELRHAPQPAPGVAPQIDAFLHAHRLYRFHDLVEAPEDVSLPVASRPVLRLALVVADLADREVESREVDSRADEKVAPLFPRVFVTDLPRSSPSRATRTSLGGSFLTRAWRRGTSEPA